MVFAESDLQDQLKKLTAQEESPPQIARQAAESHLPVVQSQWTTAKWRYYVATGEWWVLAEQLEAQRRDKEKTQDEIYGTRITPISFTGRGSHRSLSRDADHSACSTSGGISRESVPCRRFVSLAVIVVSRLEITGSLIGIGPGKE